MDGITYASSVANDGAPASDSKGHFVEVGEKRVLRKQKGFGEGVEDMTSCEKCWSDARKLARSSGRFTMEHYVELLDERKDHPCSPQEQAGWEGRKVTHGTEEKTSQELASKENA